jgi:hypothetical protein
MIYSPLSAFSRSSEMALNPAAVLSGDGQALVNTLVNGKSVVAPSAGTAGEQFVGFSSLQTSAATAMPSTAVKVEEVTLTAAGKMTTGNTPVAGSVFVYNAATGAAIVVDSVVGSVVDCLVANASVAVRVQYRYALTVVQARALVGDVQPGGFAGTTYGTVGVAQTGTIYTDQFDSGKDFAAATSIKLGANGRVTDQSGSGVAINAIVKSLPTSGYPFLGLEFNAV